MGVTAEIADFAAELTWSDIGDGVRSVALDHVVDTYGVTLAGSIEASARILRSALGSQAGPSPVLGTDLLQSPAFAAFENGTAGHALDYDDTQLSTSVEAVYGLLTHPSVPVLSAASAVAASIDASGRELLTAYVAGVEVACRIADAMAPRHYRDGFHTTGTVGGIGAAVAAGRLLGLSPERMAIAVGISASFASGLRENFGTMTKPLHAGRAAHHGVLAATLAQHGFTASAEALEAPRGFFHAAAGTFDQTKIVGRLGRPFFLMSPGVSIKPYPSGSLSHPAQDLILGLVTEHDLAPGDIEAVEVATNSNVPNALIHHRPRTGLEGKFSLEYVVATGVLRRSAGLAEFTDDAVNDREVQAFLPRVRVLVDPELERLGFQHVRTRIVVRCRDGRVLSGEAEWARGYPSNPLSRSALEAKFLDCAALPLGPEAARRALAAVKGLESAPKASGVLDALRSAPVAGAHGMAAVAEEATEPRRATRGAREASGPRGL